MNVLKADFLVARQLAFEGESSLEEASGRQHSADPGTYADTLDLAIYGVPPAQLVLAHRATLDVLDKVAVAANDHFGTGVNPKHAEFAKFWTFGQQQELRPGLPQPKAHPSAAGALAELAFDLSRSGLYPQAKLLRNAGTHRMVHLTLGDATGATELAHSSVDAEQLVQAVHESLRVARAAFIYLVDLVQDEQDELGGEGTWLPLPLPLQP